MSILSIEQIYNLANKVSPKNSVMLTAMARIESSGNPNAYRYEAHINDASYGLVQTLYKTAKWLQDDMGYRRHNIKSADALYNPEISLYFGNAYISWLEGYASKRGKLSEEWIVRAYNGGQGWERNSSSVKMTANHWRKYQDAKNLVIRTVRG